MRTISMVASVLVLCVVAACGSGKRPDFSREPVAEVPATPSAPPPKKTAPPPAPLPPKPSEIYDPPAPVNGAPPTL